MASRGTIASSAGSTRVTRAGVVGPAVAPGLKKSSVADRTQMKFDGGSESGPLTPRIASWIRLARTRVGREDHPIRRVEALDERSAALAEDTRQPAVHPDLRVVVDDDLEHDRRAARLEGADSFRNRDAWSDTS